MTGVICFKLPLWSEANFQKSPPLTSTPPTIRDPFGTGEWRWKGELMRHNTTSDCEAYQTFLVAM